MSDIRLVGDKYHRDNATAEITKVADGRVYWVVITNTERLEKSAALEDFLLMEENSLKWGARFEPAVWRPLSQEAT